jgi:hypothetical protein
METLVPAERCNLLAAKRGVVWTDCRMLERRAREIADRISAEPPDETD